MGTEYYALCKECREYGYVGKPSESLFGSRVTCFFRYDKHGSCSESYLKQGPGVDHMFADPFSNEHKEGTIPGWTEHEFYDEGPEATDTQPYYDEEEAPDAEP